MTTIDDLEELLNSEDPAPVTILPDGSVVPISLNDELASLRESLAQAQRDLATVRAELDTMMASNAGLTNDVLAMRKERDDAPKAWAEFLDDGSLHRCAVDGFRCMDDAERVILLRVPEPRPDEVGL